jgi:PAS domain-containing protein
VRIQRRAAQTALDALRLGVIGLDSAGRIVFANARAEVISSEDDGLVRRARGARRPPTRRRPLAVGDRRR